MKRLRKSEYQEILLNYFSKLPEASEFKYYSECKKMFLKIPIEEAYLEVLKLLKKRTKIVKEEFLKVPNELKFLAYFMDLRFDDYRKLTEFLNEPVKPSSTLLKTIQTFVDNDRKNCSSI